MQESNETKSVCKESNETKNVCKESNETKKWDHANSDGCGCLRKRAENNGGGACSDGEGGSDESREWVCK